MLRSLMLPLLALFALGLPHQTLAQSKVIGHIDNVVPSGSDYRVYGWACSTGIDDPINVHMYVGGPAGTGAFVKTATANLASSPAVAAACQSQGTAHRFSIPLTAANMQLHANKEIYIHGISPVGGTNLVIAKSGVFLMPAPVSVTRQYVYNAHQQLCKVVEPETGATLSGYDAAGNLAWTAAGLPASTPCDTAGTSAEVLARKTSRTYDSRNRVDALSFADGESDTTYSYTPDGLLSSITALNGSGIDVTTEYGYNKRRLMTSERMLWSTINWPIYYNYNANGFLSSEVVYGLTMAYAPNALGQPTKAGTFATGVSYYPNGAVKQFTYGNSVVHTMTQNNRQLPEVSLDSYNGEKMLHDAYDYDQNGNVAAITDLATGEGHRDMVYDGLDRLRSTLSPMFGSAPVTYTYDGVDNLSTVSAPGRIHRYEYDTTNRLTNVRDVTIGATVMGLDYDVQGNLAQKNGTSYTFDQGNRLRSGGGTYLYDGHGRRMRDLTTASKYSQYTAKGKLAFTVDGRSGINSQYIYLADSLVAINERVVATGVFTVKYQHTDALGSPVAVTNSSGVKIERSNYEPYGKRLSSSTPTFKDGIGYTGHVMDAATGLTYMQQRYYDPGIGRFLSVDPVSVDTATAWNFCRYCYAANNPYKFTDPDGREIRFAPGTSASFMRNFAKATRYLNAKGAANAIGRAHASKEIVTVRAAQDRTDAYQSQYNSKGKEITWADMGGVEVTDRVTGEVGTMTPALGLGHEFEHVMNDLAGSLSTDANTFDSQYGNQEERNVIEEYERPAAERLGEPQRDDHSGRPVPVACPTKECS